MQTALLPRKAEIPSYCQTAAAAAASLCTPDHGFDPHGSGVPVSCVLARQCSTCRRAAAAAASSCMPDGYIPTKIRRAGALRTGEAVEYLSGCSRRCSLFPHSGWLRFDEVDQACRWFAYRRGSGIFVGVQPPLQLLVRGLQPHQVHIKPRRPGMSTQIITETREGAVKEALSSTSPAGGWQVAIRCSRSTPVLRRPAQRSSRVQVCVQLCRWIP